MTIAGGDFDIVVVIAGLGLAALALAWLGEWIIAGWREMTKDEPPAGRSPDWVKRADDEEGSR